MSKLPLVAMLSIPFAVACATDPPSSQSSTAAVTQSATSSINDVIAIVGPFTTAPAGAAADGGAEDVTRDSVEQNARRDFLNPACLSFTWSGLSASVTFNQCATRDHTLNGTITVSVTLAPASIRVDLDQLTLDNRSIDGFMSLTWQNQKLSIDADLTNGKGDRAAITDLSLTRTATGFVVGGDVLTERAGATHEVTASSVTWLTGDCSPSSGSLSYSDGTQAISVTFLATTPDDGIVLVQLGSAPPVPVKALPICGSE